MPFPKHLTPPQRTVSKADKTAMLIEALSTGNAELVRKVSLIDWEIDNIYHPDEMDESLMFVKKPVTPTTHIGALRLRAVFKFLDTILVRKMAVRLPMTEAEKIQRGRTGHAHHKDGLLSRPIKVRFDSRRKRARVTLAKILLGYKDPSGRRLKALPEILEFIRQENNGRALSDFISILPTHTFYTALTQPPTPTTELTCPTT